MGLADETDRLLFFDFNKLLRDSRVNYYDDTALVELQLDYTDLNYFNIENEYELHSL